ncbi:MAG: hypothetical protein JNK15_19550 [Planctomycetes bacterium]|nr:hypothetical protein [Planctomycetota bacterium]
MMSRNAAHQNLGADERRSGARGSAPQTLGRLNLTAMLPETECRLLANLLDALDRLFDRECSAIDLAALLFASSVALCGTRMAGVIESTRKQLEIIVRSGASGDGLYGAALQATADLRHELARLDI